jgi:hypothetical protein
MWIEFDTKTGTAKTVNFPVLGFNQIFTNGSKMLQTFGEAVPGMCEVKTGDGVHELGGGGSFTLNSVTFSCEWSVRYIIRQLQDSNLGTVLGTKAILRGALSRKLLIIKWWAIQDLNL